MGKERRNVRSIVAVNTYANLEPGVVYASAHLSLICARKTQVRGSINELKAEVIETAASILPTRIATCRPHSPPIGNLIYYFLEQLLFDLQCCHLTFYQWETTPLCQ